MSEYSPLPGTVRSYEDRDEFDEPCTRNTTGMEASPGLGAPARLRHRLSFTSPFLAQYSALQMSTSEAASAGARPDRSPAPTLNPAVLRMVRRGRTGSDSLMTSLPAGRYRSTCSLIFDMLGDCEPWRQSTRPTGLVLLGVETWLAARGVQGNTDVVEPEE